MHRHWWNQSLLVVDFHFSPLIFSIIFSLFISFSFTVSPFHLLHPFFPPCINTMRLSISDDNNLYFHHCFPWPPISHYYISFHNLGIWVSSCFILVCFTFILFNFYSIDLWVWVGISFTWTCVWNIYFIWALLIWVVASHWVYVLLI